MAEGLPGWVQFHSLEELGQTLETSSLSPSGLCIYSFQGLDVVTIVLGLACGDL